MTDLLEIVQNQHNALFYSVEQRTLDILELPQFLFADKVAHQGIDLDCTVDPNLDEIRGLQEV
jgi:hypothetical protein